MSENLQFNLKISKVNHKKNEIYKQFVASLYNLDNVPNGYNLLFEKDNHKSGFEGKVYKKENHIVVVAKGTDIKSLTDLNNDAAIIFNKHIPAQFYDYIEIYKDLQKYKKAYPNTEFTWVGYSLTGNCVQLLGIISGEETVAFAPLGTLDNVKQLDIIYKKNSELQQLFPNYKGFKYADTSNIVNYVGQYDPLVYPKLEKQIGDVYIVPSHFSMLKSSHQIEIWENLENAKLFDDRTLIEKVLDMEQKKSPYKNDIRNKLNLHKTSCVGSYPVSGYTRADGTEVSGYTRSCGAKHAKGKYSETSKSILDLPKEEMDYWVSLLI